MKIFFLNGFNFHFVLIVACLIGWLIDRFGRSIVWLVDWLIERFFFWFNFLYFFRIKICSIKTVFSFFDIIFFSFPICFDLNFSFLCSKNARVYQSYTYDYISNNWLKDFKNTRSIPFPLNSFGILILELCSMINLKNKDTE